MEKEEEEEEEEEAEEEEEESGSQAVAAAATAAAEMSRTPSVRSCATALNFCDTDTMQLARCGRMCEFTPHTNSREFTPHTNSRRERGEEARARSRDSGNGGSDRNLRGASIGACVAFAKQRLRRAAFMPACSAEQVKKGGEGDSEDHQHAQIITFFIQIITFYFSIIFIFC